MRQMLGSLMNSRSFLKITQDDSNGAFFLGVPIQISGADTIKTNENIYELTPERYKALSPTTYTSNTMKNEEDFLMMYNILRNLGYTGIGDKKSNRKTFFTVLLPKLVDEFQNRTNDEITDDSDDLHGEGVKIIIPSNIFDIYTRLEILLGPKLSGHTDILPEASNLIDELYKQGEIQNEQQYRNALNNFSTPYMELPTKLLAQIAYNTRSRIKGHFLIVMDKSTHKKHLTQPLQSNIKQFKLAVTFLTDYNGIFNVTDKNNKFYSEN